MVTDFTTLPVDLTVTFMVALLEAVPQTALQVTFAEPADTAFRVQVVPEPDAFTTFSFDEVHSKEI